MQVAPADLTDPRTKALIEYHPRELLAHQTPGQASKPAATNGSNPRLRFIANAGS